MAGLGDLDGEAAMGDEASAAAGLALETGNDGRTEWQYGVRCVPPYSVRKGGLGGMGMFARRRISRGERIIADAPLLLWRTAAPPPGCLRYPIESLVQRVDALSSPDRARFYALSQDAKYGVRKTAQGVWQTNVYPLSQSADGSSTAAIFTDCSRVNHACRPNMHNDYNASLGMMTLHAVQTIEAGEELTVSYLGQGGNERAVRQSALRDRFGFDCGCVLCSQHGTCLERSDAAQRSIGRLQEEILRLEVSK